jgi:hypothetical protein
MGRSPLHRQRGDASHVSLALFDETLIQAALELASEHVTSEEAVQAAMEPLRRKITSERTDELRGISLVIVIEEWADAQDWLRRMLPRVRRYQTASATERARIRQSINACADASLYRGYFSVRAGPERLELYTMNFVWTTWVVVVLAMLAFVVPEGIAPTRLGKCLYRNCGKWFLRRPPKRGSVEEYCPKTSHGSSERVMRMREHRAARNPK